MAQQLNYESYDKEVKWSTENSINEIKIRIISGEYLTADNNNKLNSCFILK